MGFECFRDAQGWGNLSTGAIRGLREELGINSKLIKIRNAHLQKNEYFNGKIKDYEFVELYKGVYEGKMRPDKNEVFDARFFTIEEIRKMIDENKSQFTPWFLMNGNI